MTDAKHPGAAPTVLGADPKCPNCGAWMELLDFGRKRRCPECSGAAETPQHPGAEADGAAQGAEGLSEFRKAQIENMTTSQDITVEELLLLALDDIRSGRVHAMRATIRLVADDLNDGGAPGTIYSYRARMSRPEEIGYLQLAISSIIAAWREDGRGA